ncbi:MAG: branched-chain amino acid ABC transporter permease [Solirubrobacteraceae bacterium]
MSRLRSLQTLIASIALLLIVALVGTGASISTQQDFITTLVSATIVYGLYIFVGTSGVISFGHISFAAIGAFSAGVMTIPTQEKGFVLHGLWSFIAQHSISNNVSLLLAAGLGMIIALIVGFPLMRLSGIAAGIGTFAVLEITNNVLNQWTKIGPGPTTLSLVPVSTGIWQALAAAVFAAVVAFIYQSSRRGRLLRAAREDPAAAQAIGVNVFGERLIAFGLSGAIAGLGGAMLVHQLGAITTDQVFLELTFLTLAMLVIGGSASLWGATVGAVVVSLLSSFLSTAENSVHVLFFKLTLPNGASDLILGILMAAMLLFRPQGLTGGREFSLGFVGRIRARSSAGGSSPGGSEAGSSGAGPEADPSAGPSTSQIHDLEPR